MQKRFAQKIEEMRRLIDDSRSASVSVGGSGNHWGRKRATPLAAGVESGKQTAQWAFAASSHEVGGVVFKSSVLPAAAKLRDNPILNDQIRILQTLHMPHLLTFQLPHLRRQYPGKRTDIIDDSFHTHT